VRGLLKTFLYQHFCGGETLAELAARTRQMKDYGVDTLLDYGVEGERTERGFQQTADGIRQTIDFARQHDHIPFVAMKLTGIGDIDVLTTVQSSREDGFADLRYQKTRQRLAELCAYAAQQQQPLLVDAEESWIQDVVDQAVEEEMALHNRHQVVIYTTIQMYRHDRLQYLRDLHQRARAEGWRVGVKLVRGAYLEKENRRAHALRYPTPMQPNKYRTDHDFNEATVYILEHLADFAVCLGTHNESSCLLAAEALQRLRIPRQHPDVFFSQLYGMSDNLSFGLAHAGLRVAKYVPYGPLEAVLPYLFRRANENSSIAGQSSRELQLIQLEQQRRKRQRR
jgi:proline dehydrogenase